MRLAPLALVLALAPLDAQTGTRSNPITLQDAIAMAQHQGPAAEAARSQRDAARYRNNAFNARLLPQLLLSGNAADLNHGINPITLPDGSTQFIGQSQNQSSMELGFQQRIPLTGGLISVGSAVSRIDEFGNLNSRYWQTSPVVLRIQQDLFKPRDVVWDERVQSLSSSVAERAYLEAREDVAQSTADAFFNLYAQEIALANATANVAVNDTLYTLNKGRYEVGKIGENDLLKSELALVRARAAVEDAKLARDRAEAALRRIIDYPEDQPLTIAAPDSIPSVEVDADLAVREALKNSSTVEQANLDEVVVKREINAAKLNSGFNASVRATVGFNQTASEFGAAYQSPLGRQSLTVGLNMPMIQWGAARADVQAAQADDHRVAANNKSRRQALMEDARFSALQLQQAQRNVLLAAKADTVSAKQFEVARNRYTVGKVSNTDLYNAQNDKDASVLAHVQALRNYWTAYYHLRRVTLYDFATKQEMADVKER
ncbi:MAG TPA: TolC family protein [Gemmatimonadaceae bacterium]|nr:TolC family protein [Gemmatimonadaceae bacterium]